MNGLVFDIQRYAIHDGPGIRTTVFFKGCPLRCAWCHNPESQVATPELALMPSRCIGCGGCVEVCASGAAGSGDGRAGVDRLRCIRCGACVAACPSGARRMAGSSLSVTDVLAAVDKDRIFYDESGGGITFSGGEPLMQADFLLACLKACRDRGYHTAVDTCGYAPTTTLLDVAQVTDLFLYDLKLLDDARHREFAGVSIELILENLKALSARGANIRIRVPLIPAVNDDDENLAATARFVQSLPTAPPVHLLPYHRAGSDKYNRLGKRDTMKGLQPPTPQRMAEIAGRLAACGLNVKIGG